MAVCLLTGGAGFIGSHLAEALVLRGHSVRVLDNFSTGNLANLAAVWDQIELISCDLIDLKLVREAMQGVELVFHQAALDSLPGSLADPPATHHACATGTLHVLMAAREAQVRRVIYAGSSSAYGHGTQRPQREIDPLQPLSPYAVAKLAGEQYCVAFTHLYGLETVRLRYFSVFGPRQPYAGPYSAVIPSFLNAMLAGRSPVIHGDGSQSRDFTYVDNVVQANLLAGEAPRVSGMAYNVAFGRNTTLLALVELINELLGTRIKPIYDGCRPGDIRHGYADICRAQIDLGYCPAIDLRHGLRRCIDSMLEEKTPSKRKNGKGDPAALSPLGRLAAAGS